MVLSLKPKFQCKRISVATAAFENWCGFRKKDHHFFHPIKNESSYILEAEKSEKVMSAWSGQICKARGHTYERKGVTQITQLLGAQPSLES